MQSEVPAVQASSAGKIAGKLIRFQNTVVAQILKHFVDYKTKRNDGTFVDGTFL